MQNLLLDFFNVISRGDCSYGPPYFLQILKLLKNQNFCHFLENVDQKIAFLGASSNSKLVNIGASRKTLGSAS